MVIKFIVTKKEGVHAWSRAKNSNANKKNSDFVDCNDTYKVECAFVGASADSCAFRLGDRELGADARRRVGGREEVVKWGEGGEAGW